MRTILLNGVYHKIRGDIIKRAINPWKAQIRSGGGREFSDFSQAELEEYHDFRNGIQLESELPAESARLWWTEGIDFSTPRSAVLGPHVNTADYDTWEASHNYALLNCVIPTTPNGYVYECTTDAGSSNSSEPTWPTPAGQTVVDDGITWTCRNYLATVKIIDFQGATYFIQDSHILKWDGTNLDCVCNDFADPLDAIVITDSADEYLIVTSATGAIYTTDGATWTRGVISIEDLTTYTEEDDNTKLTVSATKALAADVDQDEDVWLYRDMGAGFFDGLDIDFEIYVAATSLDDGRGGMAITNTVGDMTEFASTDITVYASEGAGPAYYIKLMRGNSVATDSYTCSAGTIYYCTLERVAGQDDVYLKIYSDAARTTLVDTLTVAGFSTTTYRYVFGFVNNNSAAGNKDFDGYVQNLNLKIITGYLAEYANRLYSISTDGKRVGYSTAKDIDDWGGYFELTGNYGTLYDLFEGKLLSDGSNTLYFCGNQGLFTLDTTNELAYKQEVAYPPLTYAGHVGKYWNANVWVATGYGILKVAPSMATFVGPDQDDGLPASYQGYIYDMVTVNNWLVFCVNGGTSNYSSILKRNSSLGGNLQVYTSPTVDKAIACLHHSPSSLYANGRLWFGQGTRLKYMMFPDTTSNVKQVADYEYVDDSGYGKLPIFRKLAAISKTALGVAAITKSCTEEDTHDETIEVYYGLNGAAPTTHLGDFTTSPRPTILTFPPPVGEEPSTGLGLEFYTIQFAIKLTRGTTNTDSPELESLMFYYMPTPTRISAWTFNILAVEDKAQAIIEAFEALQDTNTLVPFFPSGDELKDSFNVKLTTMPGGFYWENLGGRKGVIQVTVEEIFKG